MGMEIMNNNFQHPANPFSFTAYGDGQITSESPSTPSESQYSSSQYSSSQGQFDSRQNDFIAAELRRMQQAREDESNALMQLLSRQQMSAATVGSGASGASSGTSFNGMGPSSTNGAGNLFNSSSQMNGLNNIMPTQMNTQLETGLSSMGSAPGIDNMSSNMNSALGSQAAMNNFVASSFMNTMNGFDSMDNNMCASVNVVNNIPATTQSVPSGNGTSSSSGKISHDAHFPFDSSQMSNFMSQSALMNNGQSNMNSLDYLQKSQQLQGLQSSQGPASVSGNMGFQNNNVDTSLQMANVVSSAACMPNMGGNGSQQQGRVSQVEDPGWEEQFKALRAYHLQFGHCKVPARFKANAKLGRWVMTQRRQFTLLMQGFPSALTADRIRRLESLGFVWSVRPEPVTTWNAKFQELKAYKATYGNCMVPQRYQANPQLGTWVHTQRRQYKLMSEGKKSSMTKEKANALDSIGFFWAAKNVSSSSTASPSTYKLPMSNDDSDGSETSKSAKAA